MKNGSKFLKYSIAMVVALAVSVFLGRFSQNFNYLQTSLVAILNDIAQDNKPIPPDLAIENVTLRKIADPTKDFNYYKYYANVVIKNYGGSIVNSTVTLGGKDQKYIFARNSPEGLTLQRGKSYIVDQYEVLFHGDYNAGDIIFTVGIQDHVDPNKENNFYTYSVFESSPKLQSIEVEQILNNGTFEITFEPESYALNTDNFEIYVSDSIDVSEDDCRYDEILKDEKIYGYFRVKNSKEYVADDGWESEERPELDSHFVKFSDNPFLDTTDHYFYVKAFNPETGNYAVSNILKFPIQDELNRAEFAKLFLDYADVEIYDKGESYYADVSVDAWYSPYVQTLYNLGLINNSSFNYKPDDGITREDALRVVLDYFDLDLIIPDGAPHFADVDENSLIYPYVEALYGSNKGRVFDKEFKPNQPATANYLKYLINEFK